MNKWTKIYWKQKWPFRWSPIINFVFASLSGHSGNQSSRFGFCRLRCIKIIRFGAIKFLIWWMLSYFRGKSKSKLASWLVSVSYFLFFFVTMDDSLCQGSNPVHPSTPHYLNTGETRAFRTFGSLLESPIANLHLKRLYWIFWKQKQSE